MPTIYEQMNIPYDNSEEQLGGMWSKSLGQVYVSCKQMGEMRKIDPRITKLSRRMGGPWLRSDGRCIWSEYKTWLADNEETLLAQLQGVATGDNSGKDFDYWKTYKMKYDGLCSSENYAVLKKKYYPIRDVDNAFAALSKALSSLLLSKLENELPSRCEGMDYNSIRQEGKQIYNEIQDAVLTKTINAWAKLTTIEQESDLLNSSEMDGSDQTAGE